MAKRVGDKLILGPEELKIIDEQKAAFKNKFGREMRDSDPLFFDPDADEPRPIPEEVIRSETLRAMRESGFPPEFIYAYEKTGFLVSEDGYKAMRPEDRREYDAAIDEYFRLEKRKKR